MSDRQIDVYRGFKRQIDKLIDEKKDNMIDRQKSEYFAIFVRYVLKAVHELICQIDRWVDRQKVQNIDRQTDR